MNTELRSTKQRLYRDAIKSGTVSLCWLVGRTLGFQLSEEKHKTVFHSRSLIFLVNEREHYLCVWYRGIPVCLTRRDNWLFLPGPWEHYMRELAAIARHKNEVAEANEQRDEAYRYLRAL